MTITTELQTRIDAVTPATSDQDLLILCKAVEPDLQDYDITIILAETDRRLLEADSGDSSSDLLILVKCSEALGGGSGGSSEAFLVNDIKQIFSTEDRIIYGNGQEWLKSGVTLDSNPALYPLATVSVDRSFEAADPSLKYLPNAVPYKELRDGNSNPADPDYNGIDLNKTNGHLAFSTLYDLVIFADDRCTCVAAKNLNNIAGSTGSTSEQIQGLTSKGDKLYVTTQLSNIFRLYEADYNLNQLTELYVAPDAATVRFGYPHYSEDLDKIILNSRTYSQLWQIDLDGSNLTQLVDYSTATDRYYGINEIGNYWIVTDPSDAIYFIDKNDYSGTYKSYSYTYNDITFIDGYLASPIQSAPTVRFTRFGGDTSDYKNCTLIWARSYGFYGSYIAQAGSAFYQKEGKLEGVQAISRGNSWGNSDTGGYYPYLSLSLELDNKTMRNTSGYQSLYGSTRTDYKDPNFPADIDGFYWGGLEESHFHAQADFPEVTYRNVRDNILRQATFTKQGYSMERTYESETAITDPRMGTDKFPQQYPYTKMYHIGSGSDNVNVYAVFTSSQDNLTEVYKIDPNTLSVVDKVTLTGNPDVITSNSATTCAVAGGFLFIANQSENTIWKFNVSTGVYVSKTTIATLVKIAQSDNTNNFSVQLGDSLDTLLRYDTNMSPVGTSITLSSDISGNFTYTYLPTEEVAVTCTYQSTSGVFPLAGAGNAFSSYNPLWGVKPSSRNHRGRQNYAEYFIVECAGKVIGTNFLGVHELELPSSTTEVFRVVDSVVHNLEAGVSCYDKNPEGGLFCVATNKAIYTISEAGEIAFDRNISTSKLSSLSVGATNFPLEYFYDTVSEAHRIVWFPSYLRAPEGTQSQPFQTKTPTDGSASTYQQHGVNDDWVGVGIDKVNRRWLMCLGSSASTFAGRPYYWNFDSTTSTYLATAQAYRSRLYGFGSGYLVAEETKGSFFLVDNGQLVSVANDYPICLPYSLNGTLTGINNTLGVIAVEDGYMLRGTSYYRFFDDKFKPLRSGRYYGSNFTSTTAYSSIHEAFGKYVVKVDANTEIYYGEVTDVGSTTGTIADIGVDTDFLGYLNNNFYILAPSATIVPIPEVSQDSSPIPWLINSDAETFIVNSFGACAREDYLYQDNSLIAKDVIGIPTEIGKYDYVRIK